MIPLAQVGKSSHLPSNPFCRQVLELGPERRDPHRQLKFVTVPREDPEEYASTDEMRSRPRRIYGQSY